MKKYNLRSIMKTAWNIFHRSGKAFAECLKVAWHNAKILAKAKEDSGVKEETHTWYAWKERGFEVLHESKALFKVTVLDDRTKKGTRVLSYFGASQVQEIA